MVKGSAVGGCSPITAAPTAPGLGEKPAPRCGPHQNAPSRHTASELTAKPSGTSNPCWRSGSIRRPPDLNRVEPVVALLSGDQ